MDFITREEKQISGDERRVEVSLKEKNLLSLCERIAALPEAEKGAIYGVFYFGMSPEDITVFYGVENPEQVAQYYRRMLSRLMGLKEPQLISGQTMAEACEKILKSETSDTEQKKEVPAGKGNKKRIYRRLITAAAAVILFMIAGISGSARLRRALIDWQRTPHKEYSEYTPVSDKEDATLEEVAQYYPSYIPDYFRLREESLIPIGKVYSFTDAKGDYLHIDIYLPNSSTGLNTENAVIEYTEFGGEEAFYILPPNGFNIFVCSIDGYPAYISGKLPKDELLKIAEGIQKK